MSSSSPNALLPNLCGDIVVCERTVNLLISYVTALACDGDDEKADMMCVLQLLQDKLQRMQSDFEEAQMKSSRGCAHARH